MLSLQSLLKVRVPVRFYLPLFFKRILSACRRRFFVRQWVARGVVASVFLWSFGSSLVSSVCCFLGVDALRFCLALLFHHITRHQHRKVSSRLSFAVSLVCLFFSWMLSLRCCLALFVHLIARHQLRGFLPGLLTVIRLCFLPSFVLFQ